MSEVMIEAVGISKRFGQTAALTGVDLRVPRGRVLGLLGHNGAGKTTLVHVLATLTQPSAGTARVAGFDVVGQARLARRRISLTGQFAAVDERISGRDNLVLLARLLGAGRREARARADELLELFGLAAVASRAARTYSGGTRRRLDLAASLVGRPDVVFLDEPTSGLDPASRITMWSITQDLASQGVTVLLTTQHLDEADRLADMIVVLAHGRVVARGAPAELKAKLGQHVVTVRLAHDQDVAPAVGALRAAGLRPLVERERQTVAIPVAASREVATVVRALDSVGVEAAELLCVEPTLDDAYLALVTRPEAAPTIPRQAAR